MSLSCCLCRLSVEGNHRKRKRFHARSCDIARLVICSVSSVALNYKELKDPNALLCLSCDKLLRDLQTAEKKVNNFRWQITEKLQRLQAENHVIASGIPNKRQRIDSDSHKSISSNQKVLGEFTEPSVTEQRADSSPIICLMESTIIEDQEELTEVERITGPSSISDFTPTDNVRESESVVNVTQQNIEPALPSQSEQELELELQPTQPSRPSPPLKVTSV